MVSSIRPLARPLSLVSDQKKDDEGLLAGELNGIPSRRECQTNGFVDAIESSTLTDLIFRKTAGQNDPARNIRKPAKESNFTNAFHNLYRRINRINFDIDFDLEFSKIKYRTDAQNSRNLVMRILVEKSMKQIASHSNLINACA
jgi:hypothetical protein